jgi:asparagine synthetase B (glutamine-hydrolysing)
MCGVFSIFNFSYDDNKIEHEFSKGRGPEFSVLQHNDQAKCLMGFHRLAINVLDKSSNQPFNIDNIMLL